MSSLPKLNVATFELTLPTSGKKVKYRPFLVKEHKALLMLKESSDEDVARIVDEIVDVCTFNQLKVKELPSVDVEYIFLNLRAKSLGETIDLYVNCDCGNKIDYAVNILDIKVTKNEKHTNKILINDTVGIEMRYPKFKDVLHIFSSDNQEDAIKLVIDCIKGVYTTNGDYFEITVDNKHELDEFINSMTKEQFDKVEEFFTTMPKLRQEIACKCNACGKDNYAALEGLQNFFV